MTVENQVNKTEPQVMGTNFDYAFTFTVLTKDPTEDIAKQAIKVIVSDGITQTQLTYGTDYSVTLNKNGVGGTVTVTDKRTSDYSLIVYREYDFKQESDYQNYNAFPADTMEQNLDKLTMIAQQLAEQVGRSVTVDIFSNTDPSELVNEIEALYGVKDEVITAAGNIDSIVTAAENIDAIVDAPDNATSAAQSATSAAQSEANALSYEQSANDAAQRAANSSISAIGSANQAMLWAIGAISTRPEGSAKYWAELAEEKTGLNTIRTNCITSTPQNIKLELNGGDLTLKAGSVLYDGKGNSYTLQSDLSSTTASGSSAQQVMLIKTDLSGFLFSANSDPALTYNSSTGLVEYTGLGEFLLPVAITTHSGTEYTSIDQVFDYFGYIGNTMFLLPSVKGLIPNGRNADGTLKNIEFETTDVLTHTLTSGYEGYIVLSDTILTGWNVNNSRYDFENNINLYIGVKSNVAIVGTLSTDSTGRITSFSPKTTFQAVDRNDYYSLKGIDKNIDYVVESYQNGTEWYRIYKSGWVEQGGNIASQTPVVFLKPFKNTNYQIVLGQSGSNQSSIVGRTTWNDKTTTGFTPSFVTETDWFATGEGL